MLIENNKFQLQDSKEKPLQGFANIFEIVTGGTVAFHSEFAGCILCPCFLS